MNQVQNNSVLEVPGGEAFSLPKLDALTLPIQKLPLTLLGILS